MLRYFVVHNGCEPTSYESEELKVSLDKLGYEKSMNLRDADIIIFLCCTFTAQKELETNKLISYYNSLNRDIIITGCFLEKERFDGQCKYIKLKNLIPYLSEKKIAITNISSKTPLIKISEGCTGDCSFCSIKNIRGKHKSIGKSIIIQQIKHLSEQEINSISLVGQDVAAYGTDIKSSLTDLLSEIFSRFPNVKIKLGSLNPNHLLKMTEKDLNLLTNEQINGNLHIPIQSANNSILKLMKRPYSVEEYENLYSSLVSLGAKNISTDFISGFPNESEKDHCNNISFFENHYFSFAEIFMFEPRPNTLASKMNILPEKTRSERTMELIAQFLNKYSKHNDIDLSNLVDNKQVFNTNINI